MSVKYYGQVIDTSDSRHYVVAEVAFSTLEEAKAFVLGVKKAAECADYDEMYGQIANAPAEDE